LCKGEFSALILLNMSGGLGHLTYQSEQIILNVLEYLLPILVNHLVNLIQMTINFLFVYVSILLFYLLIYFKVYM
jgi:hypothetical protein